MALGASALRGSGSRAVRKLDCPAEPITAACSSRRTLMFAIDDDLAVVWERVAETLENWTPGNVPRHRIAIPRSETVQAVSDNPT
jgi:hypothetical protein